MACTSALRSVNASAAKSEQHGAGWRRSRIQYVGSYLGFAHGIDRHDCRTVCVARPAGGDAGMRRHIVHTDAAQVAAKPVGAPMTA